MKKAKIANGKIQHVWPLEVQLKDGTIVRKELPQQYKGIGKPIPDCIIDVPDDVLPGWVWNEKLQKYTPEEKKPPIPPHRDMLEPHRDMLEVIAEKLEMSYDELYEEIMKRKKLRTKNNSLHEGGPPRCNADRRQGR